MNRFVIVEIQPLLAGNVQSAGVEAHQHRLEQGSHGPIKTVQSGHGRIVVMEFLYVLWFA